MFGNGGQDPDDEQVSELKNWILKTAARLLLKYFRGS